MNKEFAQNLILARKKRNFTQAELAKELGISRSAYACYESGKRSPSLTILDKISKVLYVSIDELLGRHQFGTPGLIVEAKTEYCAKRPEYTVEEYFCMPDCGEYELMEGELIHKSAPGYEHQIVVSQIFMKFYNYVETRCKKCEVIPAPFCVVLDEHNATVVQPDISVICNREFLREGRCYGAPDIVIEVISESTGKYDYCDKLFLYRKYGVREYWIVDPGQEKITIYNLEAGELSPASVEFTEKVRSFVLRGFTLNLGKVLKEYRERFQ